MSSDRPLFVVMGIDVEPDARMIARHESGGWRGFERIIEFLESMRGVLPGYRGSAAGYTWLLRMDPQVRLAYGDCGWAARKYRTFFERLEKAGDDVGVHTHLYDWDSDARTWITNMRDQAWRATCVEEATGTFAEVFGRPCRVHSFGDRWLSEDSLDQLEDIGVQIDLTVEPGMGSVGGIFSNEQFCGRLPDFESAPRSVYRPARGDMLRHDAGGGRRLQMVPVSTYRFPLAFELGRQIDHLRRRLRGSPISQDEREGTHARLCPEHRGYVFRYGYRQLRRDHAPGHLHFVMNSSQALDDASLQRWKANVEWLVSETEVAFVSATQLVSSSQGGASR